MVMATKAMDYVILDGSNVSVDVPGQIYWPAVCGDTAADWAVWVSLLPQIIPHSATSSHKKK